MTELQLYTFTNVFRDYTAGVAFMVANSKAEAIDKLVEVYTENLRLWNSGGPVNFSTGAWFCRDLKSFRQELERTLPKDVLVQPLKVGSGGYSGGGS